jgi:hypothetical protein
MDTNKIANSLKTFLDKSHAEKEIEIVIELTPIAHTSESKKLSRTENIENLKKAFNIELQPIANEISNHGGNIINSAWINQTVNAKVSSKCINELVQLKEVTAIDLPKYLTKD